MVEWTSMGRSMESVHLKQFQTQQRENPVQGWGRVLLVVPRSVSHWAARWR